MLTKRWVCLFVHEDAYRDAWQCISWPLHIHNVHVYPAHPPHTLTYTWNGCSCPICSVNRPYEMYFASCAIMSYEASCAENECIVTPFGVLWCATIPRACPTQSVSLRTRECSSENVDRAFQGFSTLKVFFFFIRSCLPLYAQHLLSWCLFSCVMFFFAESLWWRTRLSRTRRPPRGSDPRRQQAQQAQYVWYLHSILWSVHFSPKNTALISS